MQHFISIALFITINILFYFKYMYRYSFPLAILSICLYGLFIYFSYGLYKKGKFVNSQVIGFIALVLVSIASGVVLHEVPKESLRIDRWEMIQLFWDSALDGIYPYGVHSAKGNYPGPMPFYYIIAYPFYLVGEIGWMTVTSLWICFLAFFRKLKSNSLGLMMCLLMSSLAIYWEIVTRSTIFVNTLLFFLFFLQLRKIEFKSLYSYYGLAVLGGFLLSTRNVYAIPLIIWGLYMLLNKKLTVVDMTKWGFVFLFSFVITFIPFYCMDPTTFMKLNPFITQGSVLLPTKYVLFFIGLAFVFPFFCKKYSDVVFYSGLLLFLTITGHFIYALSENGINGYLDSGADISYYIFCFPFLINRILIKESYD